MYLCIDPGNTGTGIAIYNLNWELQFHKSIAFKSILAYCREVNNLVREWGVSKAFIENPTFQGAGKGVVAAKSGALVKLAKLCGAFEYCLSELNVDYELIEIVSWKGQVPKEIMFKRILADLFSRQPVWEHNPPKSHALDAVGIGLWVSKQPVQ